MKRLVHLLARTELKSQRSSKEEQNLTMFSIFRSAWRNSFWSERSGNVAVQKSRREVLAELWKSSRRALNYSFVFVLCNFNWIQLANWRPMHRFVESVTQSRYKEFRLPDDPDLVWLNFCSSNVHNERLIVTREITSKWDGQQSTHLPAHL